MSRCRLPSPAVIHVITGVIHRITLERGAASGGLCRRPARTILSVSGDEITGMWG